MLRRPQLNEAYLPQSLRKIKPKGRIMRLKGHGGKISEIRRIQMDRLPLERLISVFALVLAISVNLLVFKICRLCCSSSDKSVLVIWISRVEPHKAKYGWLKSMRSISSDIILNIADYPILSSKEVMNEPYI